MTPGSTHNLPVETLWLGLHKTGTTFLQKSLDLSQPALRAAGIDYRELAEFRQLYTRPLLHADHTDPPAPPPDPAPDLRQRLVFDENILALVQHVLDPSGLYPEAAARARIVADHLGLVRPRLVIGLRGFRTFLPALYCEVLKSTAFRRFRKFLSAAPEVLSWSDLIQRLAAGFPDSEVLVYTAETLRGHERQLLAWITGLDPTALTLLSEPERPGFSHKAVRALHAIRKPRQVTRDDVSAQVRRFPRNPGVPGFDPWTAAEAGKLDAAYSADLDRIRALPGVRFLDPDLLAS